MISMPCRKPVVEGDPMPMARPWTRDDPAYIKFDVDGVSIEEDFTKTYHHSLAEYMEANPADPASTTPQPEEWQDPSGDNDDGGAPEHHPVLLPLVVSFATVGFLQN